MSVLAKIKEIEDEMARTQKNKATNSHLGLLKARLAKLKSELVTQASAGGGGGSQEGFEVSKAGDARVGLVGFPSVGKSTLLSKMTATESEVAAYEFTTLTAIPGTILYKGARIQLVDLPGIIEGAKDGKGRGKQVIGVARTCSLILLVLAADKPITHKKLIEYELEGFGMRLNQKPAAITFQKKEKGGVNISRTVRMTHLDDDTIKAICKEYRVPCANVTFRCNATADQLIDTIEGNRVYMPCIYVLNKIDAITIEELDLVSKIPHHVPISANHMWNLDELLERIWEYLGMIRIYTKPKGAIPDYEQPVVMKRENPTVENFCNRLHKHILEKFKYALVWGSSVKHQPQRVGLEHLLMDEDVVQIVKK